MFNRHWVECNAEILRFFDSGCLNFIFYVCVCAFECEQTVEQATENDWVSAQIFVSFIRSSYFILFLFVSAATSCSCCCMRPCISAHSQSHANTLVVLSLWSLSLALAHSDCGNKTTKTKWNERKKKIKCIKTICVCECLLAHCTNARMRSQCQSILHKDRMEME